MKRFSSIFAAFLCVLSLVLTTQAQTAPLPGHLAMVGTDFNIYVYGGEFSTPFAITTDASPLRRYQFPTWSTDGRLAFFCCDLQFSSTMALEAYVASIDLTASKLLYQAENEGYTYAYWSPANCAEGDMCRDLALLLTRPSASFKVEILRHNAQGVTQHTAGTGTPFYFSWNRDGRRMIWHRNNRLISFFDTETHLITEHATTPRFFQAPAWSPVDDRAAIVIEDGEFSTALMILDGDEQRILKNDLRGLTNFSWSPDGQYLAYRLITQDGVTSVQVIDSETGTLVAASQEINIIAFFWSPDGSRLAYLTPDMAGGASVNQWVSAIQPPNRITLTWHTLDIATQNSKVISSFTPTEAMVYLLSYFDQFSQSHQLWSPDSQYLVYGEVSDTTHKVSIVNTLEDNPTPQHIMEGELGIWSYK